MQPITLYGQPWANPITWNVLSRGSPASSRPLLKWAGGKRQLLPTLRSYYPLEFDRYIEPFMGSGAVFFDLYSQQRLDRRHVRLADLNPDLIGCYRTVRDHAGAVIAALGELEREHRARGAGCYYEVRDRRFNPARAALGANAESDYPPALAAMLIYLNRTGYNGLFRLNRHGGFNVPAGRYEEPRICDPEHIRAVADALAGARVAIECAGFETTLADARQGDFVYCDPPYAPLSRTASFAHYTSGGFTALDHRRLRTAIVAAAMRGAVVLVSNSSAADIVAAYSAPAARAAGLRVQRVPARRAINSRAALRGSVDELIISNAAAVPARLRMAKSRLRAGYPHELLAAGTGKGQA